MHPNEDCNENARQTLNSVQSEESAEWIREIDECQNSHIVTMIETGG
jgi:hypothetical protein